MVRGETLLSQNENGGENKSLQEEALPEYI